MTFDEGVDVVRIDRDLDDRGASRRIRTFRGSFLGSLLQVPPDDATSADASGSRRRQVRSTSSTISSHRKDGAGSARTTTCRRSNEWLRSSAP
jgi:hypothetical protein